MSGPFRDINNKIFNLSISILFLLSVNTFVTCENILSHSTDVMGMIWYNLNNSNILEANSDYDKIFKIS